MKTWESSQVKNVLRVDEWGEGFTLKLSTFFSNFEEETRTL